MSPSQEKPEWKKVLYENKGYPDNYTDRSFLRDLKHNLQLHEIAPLEAIIASLQVTEELGTVTTFVLGFVFMYNGWIHPNELLAISSTFALLGLTYYRVWCTGSFLQKLGYDLRTSLIFYVFGQLFSPILHTLTNTISTNTIYMTTFFMMLIHLIFFDYGVPVAIVSNSLSISAAVFASICLASRLPSPHQAFVLLTLATKMFVLFPLLRNKISNKKIIPLVLTAVNVTTLVNISCTICCLYILVIFCLNIVCPLLYIKYQRLKDNIYGPWDEAVVKDADNINDLINNVKKQQ